MRVKIFISERTNGNQIKASQLRSAENRGRREGELLKLILQIQKKIQKIKSYIRLQMKQRKKWIKIQPIYEAIKEHPEADKEEIYKMLKQKIKYANFQQIKKYNQKILDK